MEENFTRDNFEEFLQEQVRNHRMYPKDAIWININKKLHGEKKWPALTIAAIVFFSVSVVVSIYFSSKSDIFAIKPSIEPIDNITTSTVKGGNVLDNLTSRPFGENNTTINKKPFFTSPNTTTSVSSLPKKNQPETVNLKGPFNKSPLPRNLALKPSLRITKVIAAARDRSTPFSPPSKNKELETINGKDVVINSKEELALPPANVKEIGGSNNKTHTLTNISFSLPETAKRTKRRFSYQIYIAPSMSYRKLFEDPSISKTNNSGPVGLNFVTGVNQVVRHRPGAGIEAGISFMYNLSSKVRIKAGPQFNVRQYTIDAYRSTTEVASIALIGRNGFDTITRLAFYRNNNGYSSAKLTNRYYQLALPVGVEWEIFGDRKIHFNVAGTIQPTYLINRNAYLLSTNFKNYTESPDMVRPWNINSNIEAFVSFRSGDYKWQIGPQVRYQPYSTFIPEYPIKEHLLDYGVKVGLSKSLD